MAFRSAASLFLLAVCTVGLSQAPAQSGSVPRIYHDPALGITYFYPQRFNPAQLTPAKLDPKQSCAHANLSGSSVTPIGTSAFVVSNIGSSCPGILQVAAANLDNFTREQVLRQLQR